MTTCFDAIKKNPGLAIFSVVTLGIGYLAYRLVQWISNAELFEKISSSFSRRISKPEDPSIHLVGGTTLRQPATNKRDVTVKKFDQTPRMRFSSKFPKGFVSASDFNTECIKLQTFINKEIDRLKSGDDADLIYVCMGHGNVGEQIWPGFVLEHLQKGKTVHSLLFEVGTPYPFHLANEALKIAYEKYPKANSSLYDYLDECFSVDQFLCGIPRIGTKTLEDRTGKDKIISEFNTSYYWQTKKQVMEVHKSFQRYIEVLLSKGKQIVLSDHSGAISPPNYLVEVYNTLLQKYPQQLHFLWGWGDVNAMTNQRIELEDTVRTQVKPQGTIWTHYPKESGGLFRCTLPL